MALVSQAIPNLINGVSQQAPSTRLPTQCDIMENAFPSPVDGLRKRPPAQHVKRLTGLQHAPDFIHWIDRDNSERYVVVIEGGDLRVWDVTTGDEQTVTFPEGKSYLSGSDFRAMTVSDTTFIVNRDSKVAMDPAAPGPRLRKDRAIVYISQPGASEFRYRLDIKYTDPDTQAVSDIEALYDIGPTTDFGTDFTAKNLRNATDTAIAPTELVTEMVDNSSWFLIKHGGPISQDFEISGFDSRNDTGMNVFQDSVRRFTDLPDSAPNNYLVKITGDPSVDEDAYYVVYLDEEGWVETAPNIESKLDASTMPHTLVRQADGTFEFSAADWADRKVGDNDTNPLPSFVGRNISNLFTFRNRMGFLSDANVILSRPGEFFNFFRSTMTTTLDSDPIDVYADHPSVVLPKDAIPFNDKLVLFSDRVEFVLTGEPTLTAETVQIDASTEYAAEDVKPVRLGQNIYFAFTSGPNAGVYEFFPDENAEFADAANITSHVPTYIDGTATKLVASRNEDILSVVTDGDDGMYVYKFLWGADDKIQSAWGHFTMPGGVVLDAENIQNYIFVLVQRDDGLHLEKMDMSQGAVDVAGFFADRVGTYATRLDQLADAGIAATFDGTNTAYTLPYTPPANIKAVAMSSDNTPGEVLTVASVVGDVVTLQGNTTGRDVGFGRPYQMKYRFSPVHLRENNVAAFGRLQLLRFSVRYTDSFDFKMEVTPLHRSTHTHTHSTTTADTGALNAVVMAGNGEVTIDLINDSHLPSNFVSAEWTGQFVPTAQRV